MKTTLIKIGNSKGVRIPKPIIEKCGLDQNIEMRVENDCLVLSPAKGTRKGWSEKFSAVSKAGMENMIIDNDIHTTQWDNDEWEW